MRSRAPSVRALSAGLVAVGLCAVLLLSLHTVPAPHGYIALQADDSRLDPSEPMASIMADIRKQPAARLAGVDHARVPPVAGDEGAVVSTLRSEEAPSARVQDTTGRTLTDEAIDASGLSDDGKLSDGDLAVLEAAGSLHPRASVRTRAGSLPAYVQVAQAAARRDASSGESEGEYTDAVPGDIVSVRGPGAEKPEIAARKAKKILDSLNRGYAKSMQKWLTGDDRVGDVNRAIDSRSASFLANTGDMDKSIGAAVEKKILDTADKQHHHEKIGLVESEADQGEIPQEAGNSLPHERMTGMSHESRRNLNALYAAERAVPSNGPDSSAEGVVHTEDGFVLRIDPQAAGKSSPMRPVASKAHLAMLAARPTKHAKRTSSLMRIDPTMHRHDRATASRHGGFEMESGPNADYKVHPVPDLGDFRDHMGWQKHPFDRDPNEDKTWWKESEDSFSPQDSTMVFGAGRLRRESKTQAVHNPYGWLGAQGAEVPVTSADSEDTRTGGMAGGYHLGAGVGTRSSLEAGSKLCQLVNCYNRAAIPMPPAARQKQRGLQLQALEEEPSLAEETPKPPILEHETERGEDEDGEPAIAAEVARGRPFLGDEIFDVGVENGNNNGDRIVAVESRAGGRNPNITPMYYAPWTAQRQRLDPLAGKMRAQALTETRQLSALSHWDQANALLSAAESADASRAARAPFGQAPLSAQPR